VFDFPKKPDRPRGARFLRLIAVFKFLQGLLLAAAAIGLLQLLHKDVDEVVEGWVNMVRCDPENEIIAAVLAKLNLLDDHKLRQLSGLTFIYAGLFLTEGTGLFLGKRWAEFLTAVATASFIPVELYELWRHYSGAKVALVVVNVAIVWFLVRLLRRGGNEV
jgi:uncharacterized membrane protein (DUF2068 family)